MASPEEPVSKNWPPPVTDNTILNKDQGAEEEEAMLIEKTMGPSLKQANREKPVFLGSAPDPSLCVALDLNDEYRVPYTINRYLRDYQREGIRFIYNNYNLSTGCILGDDMGLGKTVQVIGFLAAMLQKMGTWEDVENNRPQFLQTQMPSTSSNPSKVMVFLIVAPLSVLYNWKDELDTWGYFQCLVVHGLRKEEELARIKNGRIEVALTTYETLRLCLEQFNKIDWSAVVVDEAHKLKNPNSQITRAMKELRCKMRIGLTGTILQNNLEELWCVMDWAVPGCLGAIGHFKNKFSDPIEQGQRHSASKRSLAMGRKTVGALERKISPFFLRRTKALIKDQLPQKDDRVVYCSLTDFQQAVYQAVLDTDDVALLLRSSEKCDCQSGRTRGSCCYDKNSEGVQMKELYFTYLTILRKVANHAALLQSSQKTSKRQEKYVRSICDRVFNNFPDFVRRCKMEAFEALSDPMYSGKMKVLQKLLKFHLQKRDKILIFSLSTKLLDVLENHCIAEGLDFSRLDGSTKSKERVQIVKDFNSSAHINLCLVSTTAGGLGLNFVGANVVVLFDPTWNPANDLQAIDRAYRIGQCRDVTVLRLISLGTVEEVIYLRQVYKQQLQSSVVGKESARRYFEAVQGNSIYKGELFGIQNLFRLQTQGTCLTRRILEREGQVEAGVMMSRTHKGSEKGDETREEDEPEDAQNEASMNRRATEMVKDVLDFSSGSEMDDETRELMEKAGNLSAGNRICKAAGGPGPISLLQHGFSRILQRAGERPESKGTEICGLSVEESSSEEEPENQKTEDTSIGDCSTSSTGNAVVCFLQSESKAGDKSSGSDRKHNDNGKKLFLLEDGDYSVRHRRTLKRRSHKQTTADDESDSNSSPENKKANKLKSTGPKVHHMEGCSDESEDLDLREKTCSNNAALVGKRKGDGRMTGHSRRQSGSERNKGRAKFTEDIETYTSSEDERSLAAARRRGVSKAEPRASRMCRPSLPGEKKPSIDSVLGGVREVVFMHSNQRVVGGSKAEELISKAAVRDVFERKMHSQLPANHLLGTQDSLPASQSGSSPVQLRTPALNHPVNFNSKSVHHTGRTTVIIGETPKAIRRQQLEEMAEHFRFTSVQQFALEICKYNSSQRVSCLQQYYTSLNHPDVAKTVKENFIEPNWMKAPSSILGTSASPKNHVSECKKEHPGPRKSINDAQHRRKNQNELECPQRNLSSRKLETDWLESPKKQKRSEALAGLGQQEETVCSIRGQTSAESSAVSSPGASGSSERPRVHPDGAADPGSGEGAALPNLTDEPPPSGLGFVRLSTAKEEPEQKVSPMGGQTPQSQRSETDLCNQSFLRDLLGDTSILDDLLKPKVRNVQKTSPKTRRTSSTRLTNLPALSSGPDPSARSAQQDDAPVQASKSASKDIWAILSEGNDERINRLTDPDEVHRVCVNTVTTRGSAAPSDNKHLWKTNENFLWKK